MVSKKIFLQPPKVKFTTKSKVNYKLPSNSFRLIVKSLRLDVMQAIITSFNFLAELRTNCNFSLGLWRDHTFRSFFSTPFSIGDHSWHLGTSERYKQSKFSDLCNTYNLKKIHKC